MLGPILLPGSPMHAGLPTGDVVSPRMSLGIRPERKKGVAITSRPPRRQACRANRGTACRHRAGRIRRHGAGGRLRELPHGCCSSWWSEARHQSS